MIDLQVIGAGFSSSGDPKEIFDELNDEELGDLRDDTENPELIAAIDVEMAERNAKTGGSSWMGVIVWVIVIAMLVGSIAAVAF